MGYDYEKRPPKRIYRRYNRPKGEGYAILRRADRVLRGKFKTELNLYNFFLTCQDTSGIFDSSLNLQ